MCTLLLDEHTHTIIIVVVRIIPMPLVEHHEIENVCTALRNNASTARRKAIKEILEITERESNRLAISAMTGG